MKNKTVKVSHGPPYWSPSVVIVWVAVAGLFWLAMSCQSRGVSASPYVEVESRLASTDGAGARVGILFSPLDEAPPVMWPRVSPSETVGPFLPDPEPPSIGEGLLPGLCPVCLRTDLHAATGESDIAPGETDKAPGETGEEIGAKGQKLTVETPWGPITFSLGSTLLGILAMLYGQKRGWIPTPIPANPTPTPKED